jgi:hypothetical protein
MMRKFIKNIPVFFLFVAVLAILAHTIIPHDHHPVDSVASQEDACPVSHDKTHEHSGFPVHCHACNVLTTEKTSMLVVIRNIQSKYFVSDGIYDLTGLKLYIFEIRIFDFPTIPFKSDITDLSSLRAPPSLS